MKNKPKTRSAAGLSVSWSPILLLMVTLLHATFGMGSQALIDVADVIAAGDIQVGGSCVNGCVRRLSNAVVPVAGEADCDLVVQNLFDHKRSDVHGGTLNIVHSCTDANGNLRYQGSGQCLYSVCARAVWEGDLMTYVVIVEHEPTTEPHSVRVQVYLNLDQDVSPSGSTAGGAIISSGSGNSFSCMIGNWCPAPSTCPSGTTAVEVVLQDSAGDGWVGALPDRANIWTVSRGGKVISSGTLAEGHFSNRTRLCLEEGLYTFNSTAYTAWSNETTWAVCDKEGAAGGRMDFQIASGMCIVVDTREADGPPETSAQTNPDDYCELPRGTQCVEFGVGVEEPSGPSVGMYYDEACLEGGGGVPGCGGGGVVGCRVCFINRENWNADFPDAKYPNWGDCPCCVADSLGVECQGGFTGPEPGPPTVLEVVRDNYVRATWPAIVAVGGLFLCCVCMALFCAHSLNRDRKLVASLRKGDSAVLHRYGHYKRNTPSGTSPEGGGMKSTLSPSLGYGNQRAAVVPSPSTPAVATAPLQHEISSTEARPFHEGMEDEKETEKQVDEHGAEQRVKHVSHAIPTRQAPAQGESAGDGTVPPNKRVAGMPGNHHGGHGSQGAKMQWGAGRDARALMGMGTYNKMLSDDDFDTLSPSAQVEGQGSTSRKSASCIGHAVRSVGTSIGKAERKTSGVNGRTTTQGSVARNERAEGTREVHDSDGENTEDHHPSFLEAGVPLSTSVTSPTAREPANPSSTKTSRPDNAQDKRVPQEVPTRNPSRGISAPPVNGPTRVTSGSPVRRPALSYETPRDKARKDKAGGGALGALGRVKSTKEVNGVQNSGAKGVGGVSDSNEPKNIPLAAAGSQEVKQVPSDSPLNRAALTYKNPREKTKSGKISGQVRDTAATVTAEDYGKLQDRSRSVRGLGGSNDLAKDASRAPMAGSRGPNQVLPDQSARHPKPSYEASRDKPRGGNTAGRGTKAVAATENGGRQQDRAARGVVNGGDHLKRGSNQPSNQASFNSPPYGSQGPQVSYETRRDKERRGSRTPGRGQSAGVVQEGDVSPQSRGRSVGAKPRGEDAADQTATTSGGRRSNSVPKSLAMASSPSRARAVHPSQSPKTRTTPSRRSPNSRSPMGTRSSAVSGSGMAASIDRGRSVRKRPGSSTLADDGELEAKGTGGTRGTGSASNGDALYRGRRTEPGAAEEKIGRSPEGRTGPQRKTAKYSPGHTAAVGVGSKAPDVKSEGVGSFGAGTRGGLDARVTYRGAQRQR